MRLIHCADLHLGAALTTHLDIKRAKERREELLATLGKIIQMAREVQACAILIAGDLFDTSRVTQTTRRYVGDLVRQNNDLQFIYVSGNHDRDVSPLFDDNGPPKNWTDLSGNDWKSFVINEGDETVTVSGLSNLTNRSRYKTVPKIDGFHIVMLHGEVSHTASVANDMISLPRLEERGISYLALGHEHSYREDRLGADGIWCYCGCPEGRGFDECGEKGVVMLEVHPNQTRALTTSFLPIATRTLHQISVNIDTCAGMHEMVAMIQERTADIPASDMVSVTLVGEISPEVSVDEGMLQTLLQERFFVCRIENHTTLALQIDSYRYDISLKGEFIRTVMAAKLSPQERDRIIVCGLRALRGEESEL